MDSRRKPVSQPQAYVAAEVCTMDCCGKKRLLMVMTSACSCAAFGLLCIAVATDYWLYTKEKVSERTFNRSAEYLRMYSGLWRTCVEAGKW